LAVIFALALTQVFAFETEDEVIVGSEANFNDILAAHEYVLVEFYAPWCGHCKSLAPEYASAAATLKDSNIKLVKVDATIHSQVSERFQVQGYPTLKFFKKGVDSEYTGGRTAKEIVSWLRKRSGPAATKLETVEAATKIAEESEVVVIGFFTSETDAEAAAFVQAAELGEDTYAFTISPDVAAHYGVTAPKVIALKKFDEGRNEFTGEFTSAAIGEFSSSNQLPYVSEFSDAVAPKLFGGPVKSHLLLFSSKADPNFATMMDAMRTVSKQNQGKILFIHLDTDVPDNQRIVEFFGIAESDLPEVRLINIAEEMAKFKPESADITTEVLSAFAADYVSGNLKKHRMSEKLPADWDSKPVKVLTGENFAAVAHDATKHVLVEFYAPWCGHCKQLTPIWDQLAELFLSAPNVVVAKLDSTANEVDGVNIQSFPTLKLFSAGDNKEPKDYTGNRDLRSLASFLMAETGVSVDLSSVPAADSFEDGHDHDDHEGHEEL